MANHFQPGLSHKQPVLIADAVKALAAIAAGLGWAIPDSAVSSLITIIGAGVFVYSTIWTRNTVTSPRTLARDYTPRRGTFESGRLADEDK